MNEVMKKWGLITESHSRDHVRIIWVNSQNYFLLSSFVVYSKSFKKTSKINFWQEAYIYFWSFSCVFSFFPCGTTCRTRVEKAAELQWCEKGKSCTIFLYQLIWTYLGTLTPQKRNFEICVQNLAEGSSSCQLCLGILSLSHLYSKD